MAWGEDAAEQWEQDQPSTVGIPLPGGGVTEARERFNAAMDDVRRKTNALGQELRTLESYAREKANPGVWSEPDADAAYLDMADRLAAILGPPPETPAEVVLDATELRGD